MRYFIYISYNGKNYHGWQMQPNATTVQEVIQNAISLILGEKIEITSAGRTDAHVHARNMVAHFDCEKEINPQNIAKKLNSLLPFDISINKMECVDDEAHARFSAISRTYQYHLYFSKDPFLKGLAYRHYRHLDFDMMNCAAQKLLQYLDFTSFAKLHTDVSTNNCNVYYARWEKKDNNMWIFTIKANRFLRDMVRAIVGSLIAVGEGRMSVDDFCNIIEEKDRQKAASSAPAEGLYLVGVEYPKEIFIK